METRSPSTSSSLVCTALTRRRTSLGRRTASRMLSFETGPIRSCFQRYSVTFRPRVDSTSPPRGSMRGVKQRPITSRATLDSMARRRWLPRLAPSTIRFLVAALLISGATLHSRQLTETTRSTTMFRCSLVARTSSFAL